MATQTIKLPARASVVRRLEEAGMNCIITPPYSLVDIIANSRDNKTLYFIMVVDMRDLDLPKSHGKARNDFVQNAMSNSAVPAAARIDSKGEISFDDLNTTEELKFPVIARKITTKEKTGGAVKSSVRATKKDAKT